VSDTEAEVFAPGPRWSAPSAPAPIRATVPIPGSKSETNRALVIAALAEGPSVIIDGLDARDTRLMRDALRSLGVRITEQGNRWQIDPPSRLRAGGRIDCGLAGTVMRFVPPVAALAPGPVLFDGDQQAYARPMKVILGALRRLGARIDRSALPFTLTGDANLAGGPVTLDASESSQFVSGLLLSGARYANGVDIRHEGPPIPSLPHIEMTVAMLRARGVQVNDSEPNRWIVRPGRIAARDVTVEPDLSNAAPFLAAAAVTGGTVTVPGWPTHTYQPGEQISDILQRFGADVSWHGGELHVQGTYHLHGVDVDLHGASELTPVVAAVAALADSTSHLRGIAHIRGHETDRLAALETELNRLGAHASQTEDGLVIHPRLLGGDIWHTYADHRMAQAGAVLGLVVPDVELDDVTCTAKTMPEFVDLWNAMIVESQPDPADEDAGEQGAPLW
jgi:3-phosphoshikimate 1-carboxyvinyltransferase